MLIEFRIGNYRSYATEKRFSMVAGSGTELPDNTFKAQGFERHPLLRSAAIYGANASGKSNLIRAAWFVRRFIVRSMEVTQVEGSVRVESFLLDSTLATKPSEFEITFLLGGIRHDYGFVVSTKRVHEEWLTVYPKGKPQEWFHRTVDEQGTSKWSFSRTHLRGGKLQLAGRTLETALFLSVAARWNHSQIEPIYRWFRDRFRVLIQESKLYGRTRQKLLEDPSFKSWATGVLTSADTGIHRFLVREREQGKERWSERFFIASEPYASLDNDIEHDLGNFLDDFMVEVRTTHRLPGTTMEVEWDIDLESNGTQMMLQLLGPIYEALQVGGVLFIDELDTSLHPHLTRQLVRLFHDPESNPKGAQLIFTTHDTSLLDPTLFRRDQIWFTAKDASGATDLYSLDDYKPRKDEAIQKGYLAGRYGAVPILERFESAVSARKPDKTAGDG
ncbi:MAG TPA: ATP-binding protein [Isosphaeraceae bacterium]|nr:ATP-binding protein [Isosphaeraceae bacterium]